MDRLSPGLREDIGKLVGTLLDRPRLRDLASRIETEQPRYVAALRITADPDGSARVVFVVGRMRDQENQANVNARYLVDEVEIRGIDEARLDRTLRDDIHALVGKPLDSEEAERLAHAAEGRVARLHRLAAHRTRKSAGSHQAHL